MAPKPPKIKGLFTENDQATFFSISVQPWHNIIQDNLVTSNCFVLVVSCYKMQKGAEHEFLQFDISSPDKVHTCIVIAERGGGFRDAAQPADTIAPVDTMTGAATPPDAMTPPLSSLDVAEDPTASSADESSPRVGEATKTDRKTKQKSTRPPYISSISKKSQMGAHDLVSYATLGSRASAELERKCEKATRICTLTFSEKDRPSATQIATLLYVTSKHEPTYSITNTQCYWFVETVFDALKSLFVSAQEDITNRRGGTWNRVPVPTKPRSAVEVCDKYRAAWAALAEEGEQKHRAEQRQEEERQREREQRQTAEEAARIEREKRQAAEEQRQAAEEQRQAAEEQRQAAEEEKMKAVERARAAEDANARLLRDLEALRRKPAHTTGTYSPVIDIVRIRPHEVRKDIKFRLGGLGGERGGIPQKAPS
ncbi:hypothetical protein EV401DRAFT_2078490 [Pisolithus croceorrhizus]|nr:hypothetical protein EV401DRAFT_2078490 [Pisolithus croceorrhizus]